MKMYAATIPGQAMQVRSRETYYATQKQRFVLVIIVVSLLPLFLISWSAAHYYRESWLAKTATELKSLAQSRKETIDLFLVSQENLLASLVALSALEDLRVPSYLAQVFTATNLSGVIVDLGVIDRAGNHLAYVGPFAKQLHDKNYADSQWFKEAIASGRYVSDVFSGYRGVPHFVVAVTSPGGGWLLRATINSELFNLLLSNTEVGAGGDAYIVNRQGERQTPSRIGSEGLSPAEFALLKEVGEKEVRPIGDGLYATAWLKGGDWLLVLRADVNTSLAGFYEARRRDVVIIVGAALLILTIATLLVRSMVGEIERADRQRMTLNERIRQVEKMALIGRMAASVAHEINNPLQIIGDQAGWLEELLAEEEARRYQNLAELQLSAGKIRGQVKRASTITHRLLGFSRTKDQERGAVDVNLLLEETISFLEKEARQHRISIRKLLAEKLPPVVTEGGQLQQVFLNILNNGIEAIGQDGGVTVSSGQEEGRLVVRFADSGPGLSEEVVSRIFEPFFTTKQRGKGTGLGLSVSFNIMQRLGGEITAHNGSGGGCVFTVSLPNPPSMVQVS